MNVTRLDHDGLCVFDAGQCRLCGRLELGIIPIPIRLDFRPDYERARMMDRIRVAFDLPSEFNDVVWPGMGWMLHQAHIDRLCRPMADDPYPEAAAERAEQLADAGDPTVTDHPYGTTEFPTDPYCRWCGNGSWKRHMPVCAWADHHETEHR